MSSSPKATQPVPPLLNTRFFPITIGIGKKLTIAMVMLCTSATAQITTFPYSEDCETGDGGWTSTTLNGGDSWQLGTPDGTVINQAAPGGTMSWYVDTLQIGLNEQSYVSSPVFDFTNLANPTVKIDRVTPLGRIAPD